MYLAFETNTLKWLSWYKLKNGAEFEYYLKFKGQFIFFKWLLGNVKLTFCLNVHWEKNKTFQSFSYSRGTTYCLPNGGMAGTCVCIRWNDNTPRCYKTFFGGNLDFPKIKILNKVCSNVWNCTKMWKLCYF